MGWRIRWLQALPAFGGAALLLVASARASLGVADAATDLAMRALAVQGSLACLVLGGAALAEAPRLRRLGWRRGRLRRGVPLVTALGFVGLSAALDSALELSGWRAASHLDTIDRVLGAAQGVAIPLLLLGLGVAPPFCEELLFRGLLQPRLVRGLGTVAGVTLTAALFGVAHLDPVHAAAAFALGLYLGVVAVLDGGVRAAILCHGLNNALALGTALLGGRAASSAGPERIVLGLALCGLALAVARRSARRGDGPEPASDGRPGGSPPAADP